MNDQISIIQLEGSDYEMGSNQGRRFETQIHRLYNDLTNSEEFLSSKPSFLPKFLYRYLANNVISKMIKDPIKDYLPNQWNFLKGLSEGADLSMDKLLLIQAIDALGTQISHYEIKENISASFNQCSAVGITSERSNSGGVLLIKNWDGPEFLAKHIIFRQVNPSESKRISTIGSGITGLGGINNGMNNKGLSIVYNYAYPQNIGKKGIPPMFLIRDALENCMNVEEVVFRLEKLPRLGGANMMVADVSGDLAVLEISPSDIKVRRTGENGERSFLVSTNHYITSEMRSIEIPRDAVYNNNAAEAFRGKPVHKSSIRRYKNAKDILKTKTSDKIDLEFLNKQVQSSHGPKNKPSEDSFCNHGKDISTGFGVMIDVKKKNFYATIGKPCEGTMQKLIM
ncbi:MAG: hypothetical protein GF317_05475 [Candidatus Lokiarchaeota archaeon]|nr:hypothetical protein [Candidatus Lokiarchaeota archaeon]MBD3199257.1 hypothetical protein [Candidatus Lokiarchaeota archaeon]